MKLIGYPWDVVRELALPAHDYAIFGSAPLLAYDLIEKVGDIDLLARGEVWERVQQFGFIETTPKGDKVVRLDEGLEVFNAWLGLNTDDIINHAKIIDGLPVANLKDVLEFKKQLNRPKDKTHIALIESFLH